MVGPLFTGIFNSSRSHLGFGDVYNLYAAKISWWFFPVGFWALLNCFFRYKYYEFINIAFALKQKFDFATNQDKQDAFKIVVKRCLFIQKFTFIFFWIPTLFDPFNKEIQQYKTKQFFKFSRKLKLVLFNLFSILYISLGGYSISVTISEKNTELNLTRISKQMVDNYYLNTRKLIQTPEFEKGIEKTPFDSFYDFNKNNIYISKNDYKINLEKELEENKISQSFFLWFILISPSNKKSSIDALKNWHFPWLKNFDIFRTKFGSDINKIFRMHSLKYDSDLWNTKNFKVSPLITSVCEKENTLTFVLRSAIFVKKDDEDAPKDTFAVLNPKNDSLFAYSDSPPIKLTNIGIKATPDV